MENIKEAKSMLETSITDLYEVFKKDNERKLEQALSAFAGVAALAVVFFVLDRISDYACDWYLDICVSFSRIMAFYYTAVIGVIGYHVYFLIRERGKTAASLA